MEGCRIKLWKWKWQETMMSKKQEYKNENRAGRQAGTDVRYESLNGHGPQPSKWQTVTLRFITSFHYRSLKSVQSIWFETNNGKLIIVLGTFDCKCLTVFIIGGTHTTPYFTSCLLYTSRCV